MPAAPVALRRRNAAVGAPWYNDGRLALRFALAKPSNSRPPTDYRADRRKNDRDLALAVVFFLVGVGGALIALIYGGGAAILGVVCLLGGAGVFGLLWLILALMGRWSKD